MKKQVLKKCIASIAACSMMVTAVPLSAHPAEKGKNMITNSDFENGVQDWGIYKESGGVCNLHAEDGKLALTISDVGRLNYSVQVFYDIVPLYKNGVYRLKYDIYSDIGRYIEGMIQQNGGTYQSYTWKGLALSTEPKTIDYQFTMKQDTDIMAKLVFNCGLQEDFEGPLPEHTIYIDNVSLELVEDSNVDYNAGKPYAPSININQVGYRPDAVKKAVFRDVTDQTEFSVINADTKEKVYTGKLENEKNNTLAGETDWTGDFSSVKDAGKYYISCEGLDNSYTFEIGDKVYSNLLDDSVRMLYLQRCGVKVEDEEFGHEACHTKEATIYGTNEKIDVSGGWHDAGDYGRYVVPAAKAVADLLYAYQDQPELYGDNIGIPESGNNVPDVLDEARFELEWMMKMQAADGGAYHKVSCETFPGYIMPTAETAPLYVTPVSSTATADFCASMALAAEFYEKYDKDFAEKCMAAAEKSWAWLEANPDFLFKNPKEIVTGEYGDRTDKDERYWAAVQMYRATGDEKYLAGVSKAYTGLDWSTVGDYGNIAILTMKNADKDSEVYKNAKAAVLKQADDIVKNSEASSYGDALTEYNWGSNMTIANAGIICGIAEQLTDDASYGKAAQSQLNYLLGTNSVGTCFVSGYGTVSPEHPHHRPSMAVGKAMKGMLAGGVNQNLEDSAAKAYCRDNPAAKCFIDNAESYSTNEITIYWNSPLTYLLTLTEKSSTVSGPVTETTTTTTTTSTTTTTTTTSTPDVTYDMVTPGDTNCDGTVELADAILIMQALANPNKYGLTGSDERHLTGQGKANGDVTGNKDGLTSDDALTIQMYLLKLIGNLPA
ncbi:glycoside hydrolase family 9 protein [uncultured Ruminococcus sp.]|uniref:glycoside hydrolase family 9 protein n=1 Tax=uncultured Ruminococcus sp. TaxID=165186 RepID=UPI002603A411|nr:glycoside hydrolase family 9 protein [uncultured Ruminococcus sp.]